MSSLRAQVKTSSPHPPDPWSVCRCSPQQDYPDHQTVPPPLSVNNRAKDLHWEEEEGQDPTLKKLSIWPSSPSWNLPSATCCLGAGSEWWKHCLGLHRVWRPAGATGHWKKIYRTNSFQSWIRRVVGKSVEGPNCHAQLVEIQLGTTSAENSESWRCTYLMSQWRHSCSCTPKKPS